MHRNEIILIIIFIVMILLWATSSWHKLPTTLVCLGGVTAVLFFRVDRWMSMAGHAEAWDTLVWLGGLLTLATALKDHGVIQYFSGVAQSELTLVHPLLAGILLALVYFYSMYGFSMLTGHIIAFAGAFLLIAQQAGTPALLMVPLVAYLSSLCGCLTNYSTGPFIIYFNQGHITPACWFRVGFFVSLFHLMILGRLWIGLLETPRMVVSPPIPAQRHKTAECLDAAAHDNFSIKYSIESTLRMPTASDPNYQNQR